MFFLGSGETCIGRGGSRAAATSKMEPFVIIVYGFQALTIIAKCSIFDVAAVLDLPLTWNMEIDRKGKDMEIGRNQGSEELLKLGGSQKIFILRGDCAMRGG